MQDLQRDLPAELPVLGTVDHAHGSRAQSFEHLVERRGQVLRRLAMRKDLAEER